MERALDIRFVPNATLSKVDHAQLRHDRRPVL